MKNIHSTYIIIVTLLFSLDNLLSQDNLVTDNYVNIANELIVRTKLSSRLPEVINKEKFNEIASKLDSIAQLNGKFSTRFNILDPEFHWCFAKLNALLGDNEQAIKHYIQYNKVKYIDIDRFYYF